MRQKTEEREPEGEKRRQTEREGRKRESREPGRVG